MSDELADNLERRLQATVELLGGHSAAVDVVGDKFHRDFEYRAFEYRAVLFGRNCSFRLCMPGSDAQSCVEYVVQEMAKMAMKRAFKIAARKEEEALNAR